MASHAQRNANLTDKDTLAKATRIVLESLLESRSEQEDRDLRSRLRMGIRVAHENKFSLELDNATGLLGALMRQANTRSRARGWL